MACSFAQQKVHKGYGIVMVGTCFEFYTYDSDRMDPFHRFDEFKIMKVQIRHDSGKPVRRTITRTVHWTYDMRGDDEALESLSDALEDATTLDVEYLEETIGGDPQEQ